MGRVGSGSGLGLRLGSDRSVLCSSKCLRLHNRGSTRGP